MNEAFSLPSSAEGLGRSSLILSNGTFVLIELNEVKDDPAKKYILSSIRNSDSCHPSDIRILMGDDDNTIADSLV